MKRATSKQTQCGHAIGCELVKHKVLLTVDRVPLLATIFVLSVAMQKIAQKVRFSVSFVSLMHNGRGLYDDSLQIPTLVDSGAPVSMALALFTINHLPIMAPAVKLSRRASHWLRGVTCSRAEEKVAICDLLAVEFTNEEFACFMYVVDVQRLADGVGLHEPRMWRETKSNGVTAL